MIKTEEEHEMALGEIARLMSLNPAPESKEGFDLERLTKHVEAYENEHYPIGEPTAEEAAAFRREQENGE